MFSSVNLTKKKEEEKFVTEKGRAIKRQTGQNTQWQAVIIVHSFRHGVGSRNWPLPAPVTNSNHVFLSIPDRARLLAQPDHEGYPTISATVTHIPWWWILTVFLTPWCGKSRSWTAVRFHTFVSNTQRVRMRYCTCDCEFNICIYGNCISKGVS